MIALLVSAVLLGAGQTPQKSLYREMIPNPTGNNGYEEYLMACDLIKSSGADLFASASPQNFEATIKEYEAPPPKNVSKEERELFEMDRPSKEEYETAKKYRSYTILQLRREAYARGSKALDLLNRGNKKPVFDPRSKFDAATMFPEYTQMKTLSRISVAAAYVAFADGQPSRGTQYLCDAIILGQNISDGVLIARLVGISIQAIAFAAVERYLPSISGKDALQLEALAPRLIENPPAAVKTLTKEFDFMDSNLELIFKDPEAMLSGFEDKPTKAEQSAIEMIKKLGSADRQRVVELCKREMVRSKEMLLAAYKRPESQWDTPVDTGDSEFDENRTINSVNDLAVYISLMTTPVFGQVGTSEVRNRTQIRLLGLAGAVIRFKWEHDRWPTKLSDAVGQKGIYDPASEDEFQYIVENSGFRVYSKGTKRTGEIALKYRPQIVGQNDTPPPTR